MTISRRSRLPRGGIVVMEANIFHISKKSGQKVITDGEVTKRGFFVFDLVHTMLVKYE